MGFMAKLSQKNLGHWITRFGTLMNVLPVALGIIEFFNTTLGKNASQLSVLCLVFTPRKNSVVLTLSLKMP